MHRNASGILKLKAGTRAKMTLSEELEWRGFVYQTTFTDINKLDTKPIAFYWGVDPSVDSMTIGNLAIAMMVRHFINHKYPAVLLVGGATGMIGDPDGKSEERQLKPLDEVKRNKAAIVRQYKQLFAGQRFAVVDNYDWFRRVGFLSFLRDVGKHVPMRQMLGREFIQTRLREEGAGISYAEFSYSLLQAYDFLHLFRSKDVILQVCGADQWGNSIAGVDLIRRIDGAEAHVWSAPLVVNAVTGVKFGKTESGAVWLDENKTSVYQFFQFWLNVDDESAERFLKLYTLLDKAAIEQIMKQFEMSRGARTAQKALAYEVTKLVHGSKKADAVRKTTEVLFGSGDVGKLSAADIVVLKQELPVIKASRQESLTNMLVSAKLADSTSEANRLIAQGAITLNGQKMDPDEKVGLRKGSNLLKRGRNSFAIVDC
jgi:tyrosyl-tRNA synthetase